jgi:hypothetical protein
LNLGYVSHMRRPFLFFIVLLLGLAAGASSTGRPPSWSDGIAAASMAEALVEVEPIPISLPDSIAVHVGTASKSGNDTAIFYFSPTCPHCQNAMPEIGAIAGKGNVSWLGVAVASASEESILAFKKEYGADFPIVVDEGRSFSMMLGARSTPNVYLVRESSGGHELLEAYTPFSSGMGSILLLRRDKSDPFKHFQGYQGSRACSACHSQEGLSWAISHHAQAYYTLYKQDKVDDAECVRCHVTGMGEETGFLFGDHASHLTDVGCEACHGPSGPHDGEAGNARSSCGGCHNAEHSISFSLPKGMPHIDHYLSNTLSDSEIQARVNSIADGTAGRPLLAFPEEETVGAEACAECHADVHPGDPHSLAMKSLPRKKKKKVECLVCHATPDRLGPPMDDASGYRVEESVGCESCHGPGRLHVQSPSKENITGLGDSCPVCVLEALCTSCHTDQWDPDWDLDKRLTYYREHRSRQVPSEPPADGPADPPQGD